jgi:hypothetical protein
MSHTTLTTSQVARHLGVSAERVRQITRAGRLVPVRTPLGCLYSVDDVDRFARSRAAPAPARDRLATAVDDPGTVRKRCDGAEAVSIVDGLRSALDGRRDDV